MKCCVIACINDTKTTPNHQGITFHPIPKTSSLRTKWNTSLGKHADLKQKGVICSEHFVEQDFWHSKTGTRNLRRDAVPNLSTTDANEVAAFKVCRICLSVDRKMYDLEEFNLHDSYRHLTGLLMDPGLPRVVCFECGHRLRSLTTFRNKALKAHNLLTDIYITSTTKYLTLHQVKSINPTKNKLKSSLIQTIHKQTDHDYHIKEHLIIKSEKNNENSYNNNEIDSNNDDDNEFNYNDNDDNGFNDADNGLNDTNNELNDTNNELNDTNNELNETNNEFNDEKDNLPIIQVEIKDENNEIYFNEYENGFESDDDKKLSEIYLEKPKTRLKVKKKRGKVEKKVKVKRKDDSGDDPSTTLDKYKNTYIKRRRTTEGPDENLFTITTLTYDEQIAEVEQRQESNSYKNSPYRCTVCYRGFMLKDRFDAHIVRHSEQCGAFECFICKTRSKSARALRKHLTAQHTEKFSCKGCPFTTRNRGVAREHEKWHAGAKYQCPHCPSEFDKVTTYMGHIRIKHVSDFVCPLCGYTFVSQKGIDVHKKKKHRLQDDTIPEDGPYCSVCEVKFVSEEAHARHLKLSSRHMSDDDPNRLRNDSQSMNTGGGGVAGNTRTVRRIERRPVIHGRVVDNNVPQSGPVTCEQCGIQLRDLRLYAQHFRRAHPDKNRTKYPAMKTPCMCEQCGRIFQSMALLKDHMWVHTGEKRFKCTRCPKSFTQKTNLVFHERVHSSTRPTYECPLCGKHFAFFNNRRRHMFIHTGLKPFKCDTCGKCFTTQGEQRAHVEHVHMKKPWPKRSRRRDDGWQDKCNED